MRKGEWLIAGLIGLLFVGGVVKAVLEHGSQEEDRGIPFYSTAPQDLQSRASDLYRELGCRDCHSLWGVKSVMQAVPAPSLDGIGTLRSRDWLYAYFSSENPQQMVSSRLKEKYRMPSYASLPEEQRALLADYFASLKVKDWYLEETKKAEYEKLTGKKYAEHQQP